MGFSLDTSPDDGYLDGQLLIAMPGMEDQRFRRSVVYICAHSEEGAMGIVVNQAARKIKFPELLVQLEVIGEQDAIRLPPGVGGVQVLRGGPVETGRGFVLHSADYLAENSTLAITDDVCLTATVDILRAMAKGLGPQSAVLALGYAAWSPGQLEAEIQANGWLHCPADASFLFDSELEGKYARAIRKLGIEPAMLSAQTGHA